MKTFLQSLRLLAGLTLLCGGLYPLAVWAVGQLFFHHAAEGSVLTQDDHVVGSALLAQKTTDPRYFSPRPSAGDYATVASGASNLAWTSAKLRDAVAANEKDFRTQNQLTEATPIPADLTTTSGSGLDPDLSPEAVRLQIPRVASARHLAPEKISALINRRIETSLFGPTRINVLQLNLLLDQLHD